MTGEILLIKSLSSIKLERAQLGILTSTLASKGITNDLSELQRISVKLFESQFLHAADAILIMEEDDCAETIDELTTDPADIKEED